MLQPGHVSTPSVVGKSIPEALLEISDAQLSMRVLELRDDGNYPAYTILKQIPQAEQSVKVRQTIYVVASQKPQPVLTPSITGKTIDRIQQDLQNLSIDLQTHLITSNYPRGTCIGQFAAPGEPLRHNTIIAYIAEHQPQKVIWPNLCGKTLNQALLILERYEIEPEIIYQTKQKQMKNPVIIAHYPVAGTIGPMPEKVELVL